MDNDSNQIEEIKNRLDIVQVVEKYVALKQAGKNFSGLCPFHHEKTPSFIVSPDIQRYKCFGCGETGDIFNFVQKIENLDFPEALEKLAKQAGVELKQYQKNPKYSNLEDINYLATRYYYNELKQNSVASKYMEGRGFSKVSLKNFGIGYAPKYPNLLTYINKHKKYTVEDLIASGLFVNKEGKIKEKFYDRIMFPIRSSKGNVIGFTGRILPGNDYGPKYMNSPDTLIFHKKFNLFGQYESRQEIRKKDLAILCEGSPEVIAAHQNGIKNIVAPLGTGLTKEQLEALSHLSKNILFFFNSDSAGQAAVIRAFKLASELNLYPYASSAAPYKDIDEMLQSDKTLFSKLIENKQEAFSYILTNYLKEKDLSKLQDLTQTQFFLKDLLAHVTNSTLLKHYKDKVKLLTKLDIDEEKVLNKDSNVSNSNTKGFLVKLNNNSLEKTYLQLLIYADGDIKNFYIPSRYISSKELRDIYLVIKHSQKKDLKDIVALFDNNPMQKILIEEIIFKSTDLEEDLTKQLASISYRLKREYLTKRQKELSVKIAIAEESNDTTTSENLMQRMIKITKLLKDTPHD